MEEIDHVPLNYEQTTMRYLTPLALLLLLLCSLPGAAQQTRLHGMISSATGEPLVKAHVRLVPHSSPKQLEMISAPEFRVAEVAEDGSWSMVGVVPGLYDLLVTAVDHDYMRTLLPVDGSDPEIGLDVRLPTPVYVETTAGDSGAVMPRDAWLAELYQLSDSLDREDQAVARATTYGERHPTMEETERGYALVEGVERRRRSEMIEMMRSEEAPLPLRRYAAVQLAIIEKEWMRGYRPWHNPDSTLRKEITALVPATSPWWDLTPYTAYDLYVSQESGSDEWRERITEIHEETTAWGLRGILLAMLTLDAKGADVQIAVPIHEMNTRNRTEFLVSTGIVRDPDTARFERLHADLLEEYAHYWMVDYVVRMEK